MDVVALACPTCGCREIHELVLNNGFGVCPSCGGSFVIKRARDLALVEIDKTKDLKTYRKHLDNAIKYNDITAIIRYSQQILDIIPEDYFSRYFFAYAKNEMGNHSYLANFYKNEDIEHTPDETRRIAEHIIEFSALRDHRLVLTYLSNREDVNPNYYCRKYVQCYDERRKKEELYDDVERDVFICHRSTDSEIAQKICKSLEEDGNICWISSRNLRPNDSENYWDNIKKAIKRCKLFLVVSSEDAMYSTDVKKELSVASELKKKRIECKIDNPSRRITLFKEFFDGLTWVDFTCDEEKALANLKNRVYQMLVSNENTQVIDMVQKANGENAKSSSRVIYNKIEDIVSLEEFKHVVRKCANNYKDIVHIRSEKDAYEIDGDYGYENHLYPFSMVFTGFTTNNHQARVFHNHYRSTIPQELASDIKEELVRIAGLRNAGNDIIIERFEDIESYNSGEWGENFCTKCNSTLDLQKGYDPQLPIWKCKVCGEIITGETLKYPDVVWLCDSCESLLNNQVGFNDKLKKFECTNCGYLNDLSEDNIRETEYETTLNKKIEFDNLSNNASVYKEKKKEVSHNDLYNKYRRENNQTSANNDNKFKTVATKTGKVGLAIFLILLAMFSLVCMICIFAIEKSIVGGILMLLSFVAILLLVVILFAKKQTSKKIKTIISICAFALFIAGMVVGTTGSSFDWDEIILKDKLPNVAFVDGEVMTNSNEELYIYNIECTEKEFADYVAKCKDLGYNHDIIEDNNSSFKAYNSEGYKLELTYISTMNIKLEIPMEMQEIEWPSGNLLASQAPVPRSTIGKIWSISENKVVIYVGETSKEEFNQYIDLCIDIGFNVKSEQTANRYTAKNQASYKAKITYEGNEIMRIEIEEPQYDTIISVKCQENLVFSKYDVNIYIDDLLLGKIEHGKSDNYALELTDGFHTIKFVSVDDSDKIGQTQFNVTRPDTYNYEIHCTKDGVVIFE